MRGVCYTIPQEARKCSLTPHSQSPSPGSAALGPQLFRAEGHQSLQHLPSDAEPTTLKTPLQSFLFCFLPPPWTRCSPRYRGLLLSYRFLGLEGSACDPSLSLKFITTPPFPSLFVGLAFRLPQGAMPLVPSVTLPCAVSQLGEVLTPGHVPRR